MAVQCRQLNELGDVAELADALVLGISTERCVGSTPTVAIQKRKVVIYVSDTS